MEDNSSHNYKTFVVIYLGCIILLFGGQWILLYVDMGSPFVFQACDLLSNLLFLFLMLSISIGLGFKLLKLIRVKSLNLFETFVFSLFIGMGVLAYQVMVFGLLGLLEYWVFTTLIIINVFISLNPLSKIIHKISLKKFDLSSRYFLKSWFSRGASVVLLILLVLSVIQALTPPWSPDSLTYHLEGPQLFLDKGSIYLLPDVWGANGPFTLEMIYMLGVNFRLISVPKLVHLIYGVGLFLVTYAFGKRFLSREIAWMGSLILIGIPIYPIWSTISYVDLAWAVYEFGALYALLVWFRKRKSPALILSGIMIGFGMGTKYLAIGGWLILFLLLIWFYKKIGLGRYVFGVGLFVGVSLLIASPWYLKNWILGGNPVYPLYFGGVGWSTERVSWLMEYLHSYGEGKSVANILMLPWNIYAHHEKFSTFLGSIEIPSLLYPVLILIPFIKRSKIANILLAFSITRMGLWISGSQQVRFLLPMMPGLSLLTAYIFMNMESLNIQKRLSRIIARGVIGGVLLSTCIYSFIFFVDVNPLPVVLGLETAEEFLRRNVYNYKATEYIQNELPKNSKVFMLWDGEGYFCDDRCWADTEHSQWTRNVTGHYGIDETSKWLSINGVTHLLLTREYANFILTRDDNGYHRRAYSFLMEQYKPKCLKRVYSDEHTTIWSHECPR